ncbi:MAG: leucine-rich repeat domain-containing protein [Coprobacillus sp.]|nr:leucine-rich repeat domain-containing protein [Coprobacillus sp.]
MARKKNEINGIKIIRRYSGAVILYGIFCLVIIAAIILPLFTDVFLIGEYDESLGEIVYYENTGMDFFTSLFGGSEALSPIDSVTSKLVWGTSFMEASTLCNWIMYIWDVIYIILLVIAVVLLIKAIRLLVFGRTRKYEAPRTLSIATLILLAINVLLVFLVAAFCNSYYSVYYPELSEDLLILEAQPSLYTWIGLGISLVSMIVMIIICGTRFANRVYVGDLPWDKEYIKNEINGNKKQNIPPQPEGTSTSTTSTTTKYVSSGGQYVPLPPIYITNSVAPAASSAGQGQVVGGAGGEIEPAVPPAERTTLPPHLSAIGGHDFAQNLHLQEATIPDNITRLGTGAFSNCVNLKSVNIPKGVVSIGANCFFNCSSLTRISYGGTKEEWKQVKRGSNWLSKAGTTIIICTDGAVSVNPYK